MIRNWGISPGVKPDIKVSQRNNTNMVSFAAAKDTLDLTKPEQQESKVAKLKTFLISFLSKILSVFNNKSKQPAQPLNLKDSSASLKKVSQLMNDVARIIEEDQGRAVPVFKNVKQGTFQKMFEMAYARPKTPVLIGVSGGSASGKTTVQKKLVKEINANAGQGKPVAQSISQDNYYKDFSDEIKKKGADYVFTHKNLDHPKTVDLTLLAKDLSHLKKGQEVHIPDFLPNGTGVSKPAAIPIQPTPLIFTEGLFTLTDKKVNNQFDLKIFVDASKEVRSERWWARAPKRDIQRDEPGMALYNRTFTMHDKFVEPGKAGADIVISTEAQRTDMDNVMTQLGKAIAKAVSFTGLFERIR